MPTIRGDQRAGPRSQSGHQPKQLHPGTWQRGAFLPKPSCTGPSGPGACHHTSPLLLTKHLSLRGFWSSQPCWASTATHSLTSLAPVIINLQDFNSRVSPGGRSAGPGGTSPTARRSRRRWGPAGQSVVRLARPSDAGVDAAPNFVITCILSVFY